MALHNKVGKLIMLLALLFSAVALYASDNEALPAYYMVKTSLNVREAPSASSKVMGSLKKDSEVLVDSVVNGWAAIVFNDKVGYASKKYLSYQRPVETLQEEKIKQEKPFSLRKVMSNFVSVLIIIAVSVLALYLLQKISVFVLMLFAKMGYWLYWVVCIPFMLSNRLQWFLAKPWRFFYMRNHGNDSRNAMRRRFWNIVKVPLYILLFPLRLVNAVYYNILVHCIFELYNYVLEVIMPSNDDGDDTWRIILFLPWRLLKYVVYHGSLTIIESVVWTIVDTFVPALTLFHGTSYNACQFITNGGNSGMSGRNVGIWNVGGGNYAGNGIYFASARSTALHYSSGALIVCRVTLGRVLDLGMAPKYVYDQCGKPNALDATRWGLKNGYVTGEWWRGDAKWWEYCMYDWQNRYNDSWRIRPLYVLNIDDGYMQRIEGGMSHWLFRKMVINDLKYYFKKLKKK